MFTGRSGPAQKALVGTAGVYVGLVAAGLALLPTNTDPVAAPANLVWQFRLATVGGAAGLWCGIGLCFGWLIDRPDNSQARQRSASAVVGR